MSSIEDQLFKAISEGKVEDVENIILKRSDIDLKYLGPFFLNCAIRFHQQLVVKILIKLGANINGVDDFSLTPLHVASGMGYEEIVKLLIKEGAQINTRNGVGRTPLYESVILSDSPTSIAKILLQNDADIDFPDYRGNSPLHIAVNVWKNEYALFLMRNGASLKIKNQNGMNSVELTILQMNLKGNTETFKCILCYQHNY